MSTYREPVLLFGISFQTREAAVEFCNDAFESDELTKDELGLEYFDDCYILGFRMGPGESTDAYQLKWNSYCLDARQVPQAMLEIRTW